MASAATSALRLHQRLPRVQLTREFAAQLILEDSAHYLFFAVIFIYASGPITMALLPVLLFAVLHSASYSLTLLDALGQPNDWSTTDSWDFAIHQEEILTPGQFFMNLDLVWKK